MQDNYSRHQAGTEHWVNPYRVLGIPQPTVFLHLNPGAAFDRGGNGVTKPGSVAAYRDHAPGEGAVAALADCRLAAACGPLTVV